MSKKSHYCRTCGVLLNENNAVKNGFYKERRKYRAQCKACYNKKSNPELVELKESMEQYIISLTAALQHVVLHLKAQGIDIPPIDE